MRTYDTITDAANTPDQAQDYRGLGLKDDEYARIKELLGRRPTAAELAMYSVMWSEHCSYKSSKKHLKEQFGAKTTPEMSKHLLVGMGQNAGVVDIGDGWAVTFKVESHNHPSYVEPYQGAATGVGGIVRDIMSMGARPVAVMDQLRFGAIDHPDTARVVHGVVAGVGGYGNCLGLPNIGGETEFDPSYQGNPLVNALCVGVMRTDKIHLANAQGEGNHVILFGARTGGDGIGGASILASESFEDGMPAKRPSVQVGDPFMEKVLIECCLDLFEAEVVEAIQDLGAAGISCATSELAANGDSGMHVDLENVLLRDPSLSAGEILMSESQERMMAIVTPANLERFVEIAGKWDVEYAVIGSVNDSGRLTIDHDGHRIVDVDPKTVAIDSPVYDRPYARPAWQDDLEARTVSAAHEQGKLAFPDGDPAALATEIMAVCAADPNAASKAWVTDQYDRYVRGNTALSQPDDAGVIRVVEETGRGVALATDANGWYTKLDPYVGAQQALAEAYRNVCTVGATPAAVTDCLNFGNPECPDAMWQLVTAMTGLADGCKRLGVPVTGGNVSLYNSSGDVMGTEDYSINPTPVVGMLGLMDDVTKAVTSGFTQAGLRVVLLGVTREELDGSAWARHHGQFGGRPPAVDFDAEEALGRVLIAGATSGRHLAAHDLSTGGLAQGLVDMVTRFGVGARIDLSKVAGDAGATHETPGTNANGDATGDATEGLGATALLFSESQARALVAVAPARVHEVLAAAAQAGVAAREIGETGGENLCLELGALGEGAVQIAVSQLQTKREQVLPGCFN